MPTYTFRCVNGDAFDQRHSITAIPSTATCPHCEQPATRILTAPYLSAAGSSAFGLIDRSERSAHEPEVVSGTLPGGRRSPGTAYTKNPLHQRLPKP